MYNSILAKEFNRLDKVWAEKEPSNTRVATIKFNQEQVYAFRLVPWFLAKVDLHLMIVVWGSLKFPRCNYEGLQSTQIN